MGVRDASCEKGEFPFLLSSPDNYGRTYDCLPPLSYYSVGTMRPARRKEVEKWHAENRTMSFNFDTSLRKYCEMDVHVLKMCVLAFRDLFLSITSDPEKAVQGICPFYKSFTLAAACNRVFRQLFLEKDTLALLHVEEAERKMQTHSVAAIKWLKWLNVSENLEPPIQHARNGGEVTVLSRPVDGYREYRGRKYVYDFMGCLFHGHISHMNPHMFHPFRKCPMKNLHDATMARIQELRKAGYIVKYIWQCEWNEKLKKDKALTNVVNDLTVDEPLNPRDALAGGRCNALRLYCEPAEGYCLRYFDIKSLYPSVLNHNEYMLQHPKIITENFGNLDEVHMKYRGLIKCTVLPPQNLYLPVLHMHVGGKLLFPLCRTCAENKSQTVCQHLEAERVLSGTYCDVELKKAVELGYKVKSVSSVWHYDEWKSGVFSGYIKKFFQVKEEVIY